MCSKPVPCFAAEVSGNLKAIYVVPQVITDYYGCCGQLPGRQLVIQKFANRLVGAFEAVVSRQLSETEAFFRCSMQQKKHIDWSFNSMKPVAAECEVAVLHVST